MGEAAKWADPPLHVLGDPVPQVERPGAVGHLLQVILGASLPEAAFDFDS